MSTEAATYSFDKREERVWVPVSAETGSIDWQVMLVQENEFRIPEGLLAKGFVRAFLGHSGSKTFDVFISTLQSVVYERLIGALSRPPELKTPYTFLMFNSESWKEMQPRALLALMLTSGATAVWSIEHVTEPKDFSGKTRQEQTQGSLLRQVSPLSYLTGLWRHASLKNLRPALYVFYGATTVLTLAGVSWFLLELLNTLGGKSSYMTAGEALFGFFATAWLTLELIVGLLIDMKPKRDLC